MRDTCVNFIGRNTLDRFLPETAFIKVNAQLALNQLLRRSPTVTSALSSNPRVPFVSWILALRTWCPDAAAITPTDCPAVLGPPAVWQLRDGRKCDRRRGQLGSTHQRLENEESRTAARDAIRALIEAILLKPDGAQLKITLKGDLAGMLNAARDSKRSPDTGDLLSK